MKKLFYEKINEDRINAILATDKINKTKTQ